MSKNRLEEIIKGQMDFEEIELDFPLLAYNIKQAMKAYAKECVEKVEVTKILLDEPSNRWGAETNKEEILKEIDNDKY